MPDVEPTAAEHAGDTGPHGVTGVTGEAVERAAAVIWDFFEGSIPTHLAQPCAQALADAGLLLTDADRAVLDAADEPQVLAAVRSQIAECDRKTAGDCPVCGVLQRFCDAVRARREAQP